MKLYPVRASDALRPHKRRCSDFDSECAEVKNHLRCYLGVSGCGAWIGRADGYCPHLLGMVSPLNTQA